MKRNLLFLSLLIVTHSLLSALSPVESRRVTATFDHLSISDLQDIITYLKSEVTLSFNSKRNEVLLLASKLLREKTTSPYTASTDSAWDELIGDEARLYRTQRIAFTLERLMDREVFLNEEGAFVLSNGTPIAYNKSTNTFGLQEYETPTASPDLHKGSVLAVFKESIQHPNYSDLQWESLSGEYTLYSVKYERTFRVSDLNDLSDDQVIILFGKLFPLSLQKPNWAWRIFGLTSIRREIRNLFESENKSRLGYSQN